MVELGILFLTYALRYIGVILELCGTSCSVSDSVGVEWKTMWNIVKCVNGEHPYILSCVKVLLCLLHYCNGEKTKLPKMHERRDRDIRTKIYNFK